MPRLHQLSVLGRPSQILTSRSRCSALCICRFSPLESFSAIWDSLPTGGWPSGGCCCRHSCCCCRCCLPRLLFGALERESAPPLAGDDATAFLLPPLPPSNILRDRPCQVSSSERELGLCPSLAARLQELSALPHRNRKWNTFRHSER